MSITPQRNTIMEIFSINKEYYLDFYQRDYQWKQVHVEKLIEDFLYRFNQEYKPDLDVTRESISKFEWYYLNAYVTNDYNGKTFIVDGQQRLTTLTLILIKLFHLTQKYDSEKSDLIKEQILGAGLSGRTYWMGQGNRKEVLEDIFINQKQTITNQDDDISIVNLFESYKVIDRELDKNFGTRHKLDSFILYFLTRVQLVNIQIQDTKDVPMVFEVINDRGERLKPYEVLKGKLLGQINKDEVDEYYEIWQAHIHAIQMIGDKEVDDFFRFYFRSKYAKNRSEWRELDGDYHKTIYEGKWDNRIQLKHNPVGVKEFIKNDLDYFGSLYLKIRKGAEDPENYPYLYFNGLNDLDRQYLVILSSCVTDDSDEEEKIHLVSRLFDRYFSLLQLTNSYDSNKFTETLVELNNTIRDKSLIQIEEVFDNQLLKDLSEAKGVEISTPFEWIYFSNSSGLNLPYRFTKFFFARIDHFIAKGTEETAESYYNLVRRTGPVNGYHIEHILAYNDENFDMFNNDEDLFNAERNKLGAILLLQGRDNMASKNESYLNKLKIYSTRGLIWNKTLSKDFYHNNPRFNDFAKANKLDFKAIDAFDSAAVNQRQRLLFELAKIIWK